MKFNLTRLMTASLLSIGCSLLSFGQSTNATLSGIVYDPSGAAVPGATVVAVEAGTGQSHQTTSSDGGNYTITNLAIGSYKVTATASGFKELVIPSVVLHVNEVAQFNLTLQVGAVTDQVVVTTELPLLSTGSSSVGQVVIAHVG